MRRLFIHPAGSLLAVGSCLILCGLSCGYDVRSGDVGAGGATLAATVGNLIEPYTYSDMTGAGLGLVTFPPQG